MLGGDEPGKDKDPAPETVPDPASDDQELEDDGLEGDEGEGDDEEDDFPDDDLIDLDDEWDEAEEEEKHDNPHKFYE